MRHVRAEASVASAAAAQAPRLERLQATIDELISQLEVRTKQQAHASGRSARPASSPAAPETQPGVASSSSAEDETTSLPPHGDMGPWGPTAGQGVCGNLAGSGPLGLIGCSFTPGIPTVGLGTLTGGGVQWRMVAGMRAGIIEQNAFTLAALLRRSWPWSLRSTTCLLPPRHARTGTRRGGPGHARSACSRCWSSAPASGKWRRCASQPVGGGFVRCPGYLLLRRVSQLASAGHQQAQVHTCKAASNSACGIASEALNGPAAVRHVQMRCQQLERGAARRSEQAAVHALELTGLQDKQLRAAQEQLQVRQMRAAAHPCALHCLWSYMWPCATCIYGCHSVHVRAGQWNGVRDD